MELFYIDRKDRAEILKKDLNTFKNRNQDFFKEMDELLTLDDIRYHFFRSFVILS